MSESVPMPAPLRITLTEEEDRTLSELRQAQSVPYRTRDRAHMLRLNAQGMNVPAIAEVFQCHQQTVRATLKRWEQNGLGGLWEAPGRGAKAKWQPADLDYLTDCLAQEQRTYNSVQLAQKLKQERLVDLSSDRLRRLLKKKISVETDPAQPPQPARPGAKSCQASRFRDLRTGSAGGLGGPEVPG
jgi:transposase